MAPAIRVAHKRPEGAVPTLILVLGPATDAAIGKWSRSGSWTSNPCSTAESPLFGGVSTNVTRASTFDPVLDEQSGILSRMKVIVTGATGTAGQGIVKACLADERITKVVILTRRAVAEEVETNPKVEVVLHDDFSQYPDELMKKLHGAEACLW